MVRKQSAGCRNSVSRSATPLTSRHQSPAHDRPCQLQFCDRRGGPGSDPATFRTVWPNDRVAWWQLYALSEQALSAELELIIVDLH
jgi:hypothetical protein